MGTSLIIWLMTCYLIKKRGKYSTGMNKCARLQSLNYSSVNAPPSVLYLLLMLTAANILRVEQTKPGTISRELPADSLRCRPSEPRGRWNCARAAHSVAAPLREAGSCHKNKERFVRSLPTFRLNPKFTADEFSIAFFPPPIDSLHVGNSTAICRLVPAAQTNTSQEKPPIVTVRVQGGPCVSA